MVSGVSETSDNCSRTPPRLTPSFTINRFGRRRCELSICNSEVSENDTVSGELIASILWFLRRAALIRRHLHCDKAIAFVSCHPPGFPPAGPVKRIGSPHHQ